MQVEMGNFEVPNRQRGKYAKTLKDFLNGKQQCLKCTLEDRKSAIACASVFTVYRNRTGHKIKIARRNNVVYVVRRDLDADTQD